MGDERHTPEGIDQHGVTAWFAHHVPEAEAPLSFSLIAGGRSNLTFQVTDATGERWVLRRPPLGQVLATAHDMGREHRIISALAPTLVPVPPTLAFCDDDSVTGAPFYVMAFVDGHVLRDRHLAEAAFDPAQRWTIGESVADVLAEIHKVDPDVVGLGDLGRKEGYIERQLKRWYAQFQKSQQRPIPAVDTVHAALAAAVPPQGHATIVHGDYRLDNTMIGEDGRVSAVLDWELCTLGDPMADVGLLAVYWADPDDEIDALGTSATGAEGFPRRDEVLERYAESAGRNIDNIDYYVAFGYWKLACILEGVHSRYAAGVMGDDGQAAELAALFGGLVEQLATEAERRIKELAR